MNLDVRLGVVVDMVMGEVIITSLDGRSWIISTSFEQHPPLCTGYCSTYQFQCYNGLQ